MDSKDWIFQQYVKELAHKKREPLSAEFLLERGKCCGNICTNCPYIKPNEKGNTTLDPRFIHLKDVEDDTYNKES